MKTKLFFMLSLLLGLMYGCSELFNSDDEGNNQKGTVIISLTDAPFPSDSVAEANVTIDWIKLKKVEDEDSDSPFIMMEMEEDTTINLLDLSNGVTAVLGKLEVPAGEYNEIRMHVVDANVMMNDSTIYDMKIPSGNSSGLKIKIKPALIVEEGVESEILLDFDASRSFKVKGNIKNIKGFMFKPVIRAVNLSQTGEISGTVTEGEGAGIKNAHLYLTIDIDTIASAKTSKDGFYKIIGIPEGDYVLSCVKEEYESDPTSVEVNISTGDKKEQVFSLCSEGKTTSSVKLKALKLKSEAKYNYHLEW